MNIKLQVCSLELSKRLEELGVKQTSLFWYVDFPGQVGFPLSENLMKCYSEGVRKYSAFTVAELGEMLPKDYITCKTIGGKSGGDCRTYWLCYNDIDGCDDEKTQMEETEADARAKMLIYLIENKLINQEIAHES